jgi:hypothetical protein
MKFKSFCKCGIRFIPDNRHVAEWGGVEDCKPSDNLEYLEFVLSKKEKLNETSRANT